MDKIYIVGVSIPPFIIAAIVLEILALKMNIINVTNNDGLARYIPAAICLSINGIAYFGKILVLSIEKQMNSPASFYAKTLGFSDWQVIKKYTLLPAILSVLPTFMQMMGLCFASSIIVEQVFGLNGIGMLIINSVLLRDAPMIHAIILFLGIVISIFLLISDVIRKVGEYNEF